MLDEELSENERNAANCVEQTKRRGNEANLKKFDSSRGAEAAKKRWSNSKFTAVRNEIKQCTLEEIQNRKQEIAQRTVEFMLQGNAEGMAAIKEGLKAVGAHADNEERAMVMNMKMNGEVKNTGSVKLVIEDMTRPEEEQKG